MTRTWSHARLATGAALALWAGLFWYVLLSGRTSFYLSSRTAWLAPVGAVTLTVALAGSLLSARTSHPEPLRRKQVVNLAILMIPAIAILAIPPATLGSFAVSRRSDSSIKGSVITSSGIDLSTGDLSLMDIFGLTYNSELDKLAARAGTTSSFTGFVTRDRSSSAEEFELNRFAITCCPGDAVNVQLRVVGAPPGEFEPDDWVRVTGKIYPIGSDVIVDANEVEKVARPKSPYLN